MSKRGEFNLFQARDEVQFHFPSIAMLIQQQLMRRIDNLSSCVYTPRFVVKNR